MSRAFSAGSRSIRTAGTGRRPKPPSGRIRSSRDSTSTGSWGGGRGSLSRGDVQVMTETELDRAVRELQSKYHLRGYSIGDSRRSPSGWPDWVIVGNGPVMFRELKSA